MDSMPPATTTAYSPVRMEFAPSITARIPEPQTLWMVTAPADFGMPAWIAACRAGAWPWPAWSTFPRRTWSTRWAGTSAFSRAALRATPPS
jgi:hypothetical protein